MYKPYIKPVAEALPDIKTPEPHISRLVLFACRVVGRIYLFFALGIARVVLRNGRPLFDVFKRALDGKSRLILAFRHPNGGEAQILMWFILFKLRSKAWLAGVKFRRQPRISFVYGYEVVRWGGGIARWVMPGLGAMPVHHARVDSAGINRIFRTIAGGPYPLAIAPEGQVSYTTESVPRMEQGTVRIGFQAAERLEQGGQNIPVEILPVSIHFRYGSMGRRSLHKLIRKIERCTGFDRRDGAGFSERLRRSRDYILARNEKRYGIVPEESKSFDERIEAVMDAALAKAEGLLGIPPRGEDLFERLLHIRHICWDKMIIPGAASLDGFTTLERALLDLEAGEAWHASRHMELVDFIWYFRVPVPAEDAPLYIKIEYAQNLWDFANRTMGGAYSNRVLNVHPKRVLIQVGSLISLTGRLTDYRENKKETIRKAMDDLEAAFMDCIGRAAEYQI
ncbi:MAG: acyltransferase [Treponema sp.]|jgi:1-acyl-sn-glycerol-3-phosphate acyltransferase|nr:acyltransferase [Treponema sp.]